MNKMWTRIRSIFKRNKKEGIVFNPLPGWDNFYRVDANRIYIQGERRSGKTTNLLNHMLKSEETDIIWLYDAHYNQNLLLHTLEDLFQVDLNFKNRYEVTFTFNKKKKRIRFYALSRPFSLKGMRTESVYVDTSHLNEKTLEVIKDIVFNSKKTIIVDDKDGGTFENRAVVRFLEKTMDAMLFVRRKDSL